MIDIGASATETNVAGRGWIRRWRGGAVGLLALLVLSAPWWGRPLLARLDFFRLRSVEVVGVQYLSAGEVVRRLHVDTLASVWMDLEPLVRRLERHPQVRAVEIQRRLPGTLIVRVTENLPVALVPARGGFRAVDGAGRPLPVDPARVTMDLPIVPQRDTMVLRLLDDVRAAQPALFARISEVRRVGRDELLWRLAVLPIRTMTDVTAARLADLYPVERDLARRQARVAEIDLRFRDQVIARVQ